MSFAVAQASSAFMPDSSSFHPCGTNAPNLAMTGERTMTLVSAFRVDDLEVRIFATAAAMGQAAASDAAAAIVSAIDQRDHANIMLATGNSQFAFLDALTARTDIDWDRVTGFHMDEYVGMDDQHPASFARYMRERVVDIVHPARFHFVDGTNDATN